MTRYIALAILTVVLSSGHVAAQTNTPPAFTTLFPDTTISEGDSVIWFIGATDQDPNDTPVVYIYPPAAPPYDELYYRGDVTFAAFGSDWNFRFKPFYDWVPAGQIDLSVVFYATDGKDTISMPVVITVVQFNPAPAFASIGAKRTAVGVPLTFTVSAADPDGTIPNLSSPDLPAGATLDSIGSGVSRFSFNPSGAQIGDHPITFYAWDGEKGDTLVVTVTVVPYAPPALDPTGAKTVTEGRTLSFYITGNDPNDVFLELSALYDPSMSVTVGPTLIGPIKDSALFTYIGNYVKKDTVYSVTFFAFNGRDTAFSTTDIVVGDSMNFPPVFVPIDPIVIREGVESIDSLVIEAHDPEGNPVTLSTSDTAKADSSYFVDNHNGTGYFSFYPDLTDGGTYEFLFIASDFLAGETDLATESLTVIVNVLEVDHSPILSLDTIGAPAGLKEGGYLRLDIIAADFEQGALPVSLSPPADSSIFKGNAAFVDRGDGTGFFEFYPDYNQISIGSDTTMILTFSTSDTVETVRKQVVVTIYDVQKNSNDPWEADTVTLIGNVWSDSVPGFSITARIWNDSNITAAQTGFRWSEPWLICDTVELAPWVNSAPYKKVRIYNDSLEFHVVFIGLGGWSLPAGNRDYFTARFVYNPDSVDVDTITNVRLDTTSVGSSSKFVFDKGPKKELTKEAAEQYGELLMDADLSYAPLVKLGEIRSAYDSVLMRIYDVSSGISMGRGSALYALDSSDSVREYEIRLSLENRRRLDALRLGLRISSPDGAVWEYGEPIQAVASASRMDPDSTVWQASGGLQLETANLDGLLEDTLFLSGSAGIDPWSGLPVGLMELMISIPIRVGGVVEGEIKTICFDTVGLGSHWAFIDDIGDSVAPGFSGSMCLPVTFKKTTGAHDEIPALPFAYGLAQNYPNPFNAATTIKFSLGRRERVKITVYNILGQIVAVLADGEYESGEHTVIWDGKDRFEHSVASGIYLYRIISEGLTKTKKMILLK